MRLDATGTAALERAERLTRELHVAIGLARPSDDPLASYSLGDAFRYALSGRRDPGGGVAAFVDEELQRAGFAHTVRHAVHIPPAALLRHIRSQSYQTTVAGSGAELVATVREDALFIDALRPRSVVMQLGAVTAGGLVGDVQVPRMDTTSAAYWLTTSGSPVQSGAITESEGTFDDLIVAPAQVGGYGKISYKLMRQLGSTLFDQIISNDVLSVLGTAIDAAAIAGSGTGGTPTGIVNTAGVNAVSGAAFAYSTSMTALQDIASANAIINRRTLGWAADVTSAGLLANRPKIAGYPQYIWAGNVDTGSINGHPALSTANVPAGTAICGDWSQLLVLSWGANAPITVELNPFSGNFAGGDIQFRAMISANVAVRHPPSFSVCSGVT